METITKGILSAGLLGGGIGIPLITYDQVVGKPIRQEDAAYKEFFKKDKEGLRNSIPELKNVEDPEEALPKIREFCKNVKADHAGGIDVPMQLLFSCQNKPFLVKDGFPNGIIEKEESFGPSLFILKRIIESEKLRNEKTELQDLFKEVNTNKQLREGCKAELEKQFSFDETNLVLISTLCRKNKIDTVEKEITRGKQTSDGVKTTEGNNTFDKGKSTQSLLDLINKGKSNQITSTSTSEQGGKQLEEGCEISLKEKLTGDTQVSFIKHVKYACSGKSPEEMKKIQEA